MRFGAAYFASAAMGAAIVFAAPAAAQQTDWTARVTISDKGGHIVGNPLAKNSVTEYMSYTCSHCANFEVQSYTPLRASFLKKGDINFEVRNLILNPIDLSAAMLARCGGRTKFFGNHRAFLTSQSTWIKPFQSLNAEQQKSLAEGTVPERLKKIATIAGFYGIMQKRGISRSQANACLADKSAQDKILGMTKHATETLKLAATPSFVLNGKPMDNVHNWTGLQQSLIALPGS